LAIQPSAARLDLGDLALPLKLVAPEKIKGGRSWYIRGTYLGVDVFRSAKTDRRDLAARELKRTQDEIERGRYSLPGQPPPATFADAVLGYVKDCPKSEVPLVERLLHHFKDTALADFTKDTVDTGEEAIYPGRLTNYAAGTLNRMYRAPLAAVLHHAAKRGLVGWLRIEKHAEQQRTRYLEPEQALDLVAEARRSDQGKAEHNLARLAPLLVFMLSTGARITEAINITWADVDLGRRHVILHNTKNGETYGVHLGEAALTELANLPGDRNPKRRVFGYSNRRSMRTALANACERAGVTDFTLHQTRHTYATWHRRNGVDLKGIMELGRWKDAKSALRYQHVASGEQAAFIAALPINAPPTKTKRQTPRDKAPPARKKGRTAARGKTGPRGPAGRKKPVRRPNMAA
jgi:integrase